ncbi:SDR family oxidoreductase [Ponticaulis sp.]|uniref:SDR family oxidoreductase n=1 Tax=Ponticaulis sp. TaxID=2020902 RepID=UPI000B736E27|nr:SDR family NAD(P)-dependent oxidoreductase [Ponticaulis sp.]MAI90244.1 oxidoreductase [Ponticaulis sp.]OUX99890.1 MAG: oxidoreductase [Hyphomonadaceae bacterium TMED5]|tara:strand:- start:222160 stop:222906 length:747 start_codon:yes stop_codon:yes gene_type:complete
MNFTNKKILITGGNSGIGEALAEALQAKGNQLLITGRKPESLKDTLDRNPEMHGYSLDVADQTSLKAFIERVLNDHPDLDAVILNAGIMEDEDYTADPVSLDSAKRTISTNLSAVIDLAAAFIPQLRSRPEAALVTVSSGLAFVPKASNPVYSATKAAIHSLSQSWRYQLRNTHVRVHELAPPMVATELTPGQSEREMAMPLADFTEEVVEIMSAETVPDEILVKRVHFQRFAEAEGRYAQTFDAVNS